MINSEYFIPLFLGLISILTVIIVQISLTLLRNHFGCKETIGKMNFDNNIWIVYEILKITLNTESSALISKWSVISLEDIFSEVFFN